MPHSASRSFFTRALVLFIVIACVYFSGAHGTAQSLPAANTSVPGKNVSVVGPTPQPAGCDAAHFYCGGLLPDFGLKQQNEPSAVMSPETGNIMIGANDYRGADRKDGVLGDAWMGAYMSRDGGLTWVSRLAPGFKGDDPSSSLGLAYGADPVLLAFPGGVLYVFIAGDRGENAPGGVYAKQWVEVNKEDGYPFVPANGKPSQIASGTAGRFLDKPGAMINMIGGAATCTIPYSYTRRDGTRVAGSRTVPAFEATVAFATFLGSTQSDGSAIWITRSSDCGVTWSHPGEKVTQTLNTNQGVSLTAKGNTYLAVWRTFTDTNQTQAALYYSRSTNKGQSWSKPNLLRMITPFDQGTSSVTFRTTALPWLVSDGAAFHVFWAERGSPTGLSRIASVSSADGTSWTDKHLIDGNVPQGHQIIPSAAAANGVVQIAWYDTRADRAPEDPAHPGLINDYKDSSGIHRHTADVWAAQATWDPVQRQLVPTGAVKVSRYRFGRPPARWGNPAPFVNLEDNFVNSRIFKQGTAPFLGDYIAVAARTLVKSGSTWIPNIAKLAGQEPTFFVAWADNRSVRGNAVANLDDPLSQTGYTPPLSSETGSDPGAAACNPAAERKDQLPNTRNQEVFGAMIRPGFVVTVPSGSKPTTTTAGTLERAYVVHVANNTSSENTYTLTLTVGAPATGTTAVFAGGTSTSQTLTIQQRSGAATSVVVTSTDPTPPSIVVNVDAAGGGSTSVTLNGDVTIENSETGAGDVNVAERHDIDIVEQITSDAPIPSADIRNPDFENPDFENNAVLFPDMENPDMENPDFENPDMENPDFENSTVKYPDMENPDMENPDMENSALTEISWLVTMNGNTTSGIDTTTLFSRAPGKNVQLIVRRVYFTPMSQNCRLVQIATNQVIVNSVGQDPKGSFFLAPGERALVTVRLPSDVDPTTFGLNVTSQASNSGTQQSDNDLPPPTLTLPSLAPLEATGPTGRVVNYAAAASDFNGIALTADCVPASGSTFPIGTTTVACNATDSRLKKTEGGFDVSVVDTTKPVFNGVPASVDVEATGPSGAAATYALPTATDLVDGAVAVSCAPASGATFALGATTVTCTTTDSHLNTATADFIVIVVDTTRPAFTGVPANFGVEATGPGGATATYALPTATDLVDGAVTVSCTPASGATFTLGATTVTCTATDSHLNTATADFIVTVVDTTAPVVGAHANIIAAATGASGATVNYANPTATDAVGVTSVDCAPASASTFAVGVTTVTCSAMDAAGNTGTNTFTVSVGDTTPPVIAAHLPVTATATSTTGAVVSYTSPTATDLVDGVFPATCLPASGSLFGPGATTVTCNAVDLHGNAATPTQFSVTVSYGFVGLLSPWKPSPVYTVNLGSAVPVAWQYTNAAGAVLNTSTLQPTVTFTLLQSCTGVAETSTVYVNQATPGNSYFTYTSGTWKLNWQTKPPVTAGCYNVRVILSTTGQTNGPFQIKLK